MEEEYEKQHYEFSVVQLKRDTKDVIQCEVEEACAAFVKNIIIVDSDAALLNDKSRSEIEKTQRIMSKEFSQLFKDSFTKMENIISQNFSIPSNVTWSTDQLKLKSLDENEEHLQSIYDQCITEFTEMEELKTILIDELQSYSDHKPISEIQKKTV